MVVNFGWLVEDKIAGFSQPGCLYNPLDADPDVLANDLEWLFHQGIRALVSLTEMSLDDCVFETFTYLHLPISDMQAPTLDEVAFFMEFAERMDKQSKPVGVHCRAGLGRTGTILACYLVHYGEKPQAAIARVRSKRPGSIETPEQEETVFAYAKQLEKQASNDPFMNLN